MVAADHDIDAVNAQDVQTQPNTRKSRSTLTDHVFPPFYACYCIQANSNITGDFRCTEDQCYSVTNTE
jgi:hypothetical protein